MASDRRGGDAPRPVRRPAGSALERLAAEIVACERCPRLRAHCAAVAETKVRRFRDSHYWGRPVPGFGDPAACLLIVGLAPAAHGANRTGRLFTGDDSASWLFRALHAAGVANQPTSVAADDGLRLSGAWVSCAARCAPPDNRPQPGELAACRSHLVAEMRALPRLRTVLALGRIAYDAVRAARAAAGFAEHRPRIGFGHGVEVLCPDGVTLLCSYHPSRQNTQTGRLTQSMLAEVVSRAVLRSGSGTVSPA